MKTPITITKIIVSILEFKAQHTTQDIGKLVDSASLQTNYKQIRNFANRWNNNGKSFSVVNFFNNLYNKTVPWDPHNVIYNKLVL